MSLLRQLLESDVQRPPAANPAIPANPHPERMPDSQDSQDSQGGSNESAIHAHLLALAEAEALPPELVHQLPAADLQDCAGLPDAALTAYLYAMADTAEREAARLPVTYTAPALCRHCGPVWLSPAVAAVLPVVAGWPRALGCPWCHVTPPENMATPRPPVTSATCLHYQPDAVNPEAGMGRCQCGYHYPAERHACADYRPGGIAKCDEVRQPRAAS